jgi:AcrR family transcriptional regulator
LNADQATPADRATPAEARPAPPAAGPGADREPRAAGRSRDSVASKQALLQAAQELFGQRGFERTTMREIGERAGVDAALIARYFGSKAELYIAAVVAEDTAASGPGAYGGLAETADTLLTRSDDRGPGPIIQALIRSDTRQEIRVAARERMTRRLVDPLVDEMTAQNLDHPRLRAEVVVSALYGISLGRSLGWFEEIRSVPKDELVALIVEALGAVTGEPPAR